MDWLMVPVVAVLLAVLVLYLAYESEGDREDKEAYRQMFEMNVDECIWRLNNNIEPVIV